MSAYTVEIRVMPRASLLDPQGQAVQHASRRWGLATSQCPRGQTPGRAGTGGHARGSGCESAHHVRPIAREPGDEDYECSVSQ